MDLSQLQPLLYFLLLLVPLFFLLLHGHHLPAPQILPTPRPPPPVREEQPPFHRLEHRDPPPEPHPDRLLPVSTLRRRRHHRKPPQRRAHAQGQLRELPQGGPLHLRRRRLPGLRHLQRRRQRVETTEEDGELRVQHENAAELCHAHRPPPDRVEAAATPAEGRGGPRPAGRPAEVRTAFDNICKVTFGVDPACLTDENSPSEFMRAFDEAAFLSVDRFMYPLTSLWQFKRLLGVGSERKLRQSIAIVQDYAMEIIRSRKRSQDSSSQNDDLLSRFSLHGDMSDGLLRDIVISFILAGRETTSSALTWFFWLLSSRPDEEEKILEEIKRLRHGNSGETFAFEELRELHYLHAAITESLRLYPPVAMDTFSCREDDVFPDGTFVGKGWFATYNAYAMGRAPAVWGDCLEYRPERWLVDGAFTPESPFKFLAFHTGPRACLGKEMAYVQMKSIAACVLERFAVEVLVRGSPGSMCSRQP